MTKRQFSLLGFSWEVVRRVGVENDVCFGLCDIGVNVKAEFQAVEVRAGWIADQTALQILL